MFGPYFRAFVAAAAIVCASGALRFAHILHYSDPLPLDMSDPHLQNTLSSIQAATHASLCLIPFLSSIPFVCGIVERAAPAIPFINFSTEQRALFAMLTDSSVMKDRVIIPLLTLRHLSGCASASEAVGGAFQPNLLFAIYAASQQVIQTILDLQLHTELSVIATAAIHTELLTSLKALKAATWFISLFVDRPPVDISSVLEISRNATIFSTRELLVLTQHSRLSLSELLLELNQLSFNVHRGRASTYIYSSTTRPVSPSRLPSFMDEIFRIAHTLMVLADDLEALEDLLLDATLGERLLLTPRTYSAPVGMAIFYLRRDIVLYKEMVVALRKAQEDSTSRMGILRCTPNGT